MRNKLIITVMAEAMCASVSLAGICKKVSLDFTCEDGRWREAHRERGFFATPTADRLRRDVVHLKGIWYHTRMPEEFETTHMTDPARTTAADFIRSSPAASAPFLIAAASECLRRRLLLNRAELQIAARSLRYKS